MRCLLAITNNQLVEKLPYEKAKNTKIQNTILKKDPYFDRRKTLIKGNHWKTPPICPFTNYPLKKIACQDDLPKIGCLITKEAVCFQRPKVKTNEKIT